MQTNCASWKGKQKRDILWVSLFFCWAGVGACHPPRKTVKTDISGSFGHPMSDNMFQMARGVV